MEKEKSRKKKKKKTKKAHTKNPPDNRRQTIHAATGQKFKFYHCQQTGHASPAITSLDSPATKIQIRSPRGCE